MWASCLEHRAGLEFAQVMGSGSKWNPGTDPNKKVHLMSQGQPPQTRKRETQIVL